VSVSANSVSCVNVVGVMERSPAARHCGWTRRYMRLRSYDFAARSSPGPATRIAALNRSIGADGYGGYYITRGASDSACTQPLCVSAGVGTHSWRRRVRIAQVRYSVVREGESAGMSAAACGGRHPAGETCGEWHGRGPAVGAPTIRGWGAKRAARSVALRDAVLDGACGRLPPSTARFWAVNRDCSERRACERN
jgi:hypothetical protein